MKRKLYDEGMEIYNLIDMGSYGVVYRAKWRGLAVAVKTLVVAEESGVPRHRAVLEAAISLSMAHPNVLGEGEGGDRADITGQQLVRGSLGCIGLH